MKNYKITPAKYAKNKVLVQINKTDGFKNREMRLAEAKGLNSRWSHREKGYIMSKNSAHKFENLVLNGYDADFVTGEIFYENNKNE